MASKSQRKKNKKAKKIAYSCPVCDEEDNDWMVLCDWCKNWYHFQCVNLTEPPKSELWKCPTCEEMDRKAKRDEAVKPTESSKTTPEATPSVTPKTTEVPPQVTPQGAVKKDPNRTRRNLEDEPTPIYPEGIGVPHSTSVQVSGHSSVSDKRIQIELKRIEEEKVLQQKVQLEKYQIEQRYLDLKYDILLKGSVRDSLNASMNKTATEEWVKRMTEINVDSIAEQKKDDPLDMDDFLRRLNDLKMTPTAPEIQSHTVRPPKELKRQPLNPAATSWLTDNFNLTIDDNPANKPNVNDPESKLQSSNVIPTNDGASGGHVLTKTQIASRHVVTKDLPFFYGNPEDWLIFHKRYVNTTNLCGYSDGENLDRLQRCLKGDAFDAVEDLLLDVESVPDIISTLEKLFGRPELIIKNLLKKLRQLPSPKTDNLHSMVRFALDVQNFAKTVERKALNQYLSNPLLLEELVERIPTTFKVDWAKHIVNLPDDKINLMTLSDWLQNLMKALVKITDYVPKSSVKNERKQQKASYDRINLHQEPKTDNKCNKSEDQKSYENKCKVCSKNCSATENCAVFMSLQPAQRWKAIYDNKLCRKCLRKHGGYCKTDKVCGKNGCVFKHHSLLHDDQKHKPNQEPKSSGKDVVPKADVVGSHLVLNTKVILRIIPIKIYGNGISLDTFAFLDDGSTTTLIDRTLADALKLIGVPKELCLIWSSNIHRREKNSQLLNVSISSTETPNIQLKLREVRTVEFLGIPPQRLNKQEL